VTAWVLLSAPQALLPIPFQSHVCAAKAEVDMLTRASSRDGGGVVNRYAAFPTSRRLVPASEAIQLIIRGVPLGRAGLG